MKTQVNLMHGDCLDLMRNIPDHSVDMVLCDLPYGTTACKWDVRIPFEPLWEQYRRITKDTAAIVLFGSEPFSSSLRMSNLKFYKYDWIWEKGQGSNFMSAKYRPLNNFEVISVFAYGKNKYFPQPREFCKETIARNLRGTSLKYHNGVTIFGDMSKLEMISYAGKKEGYPNSVLHFKKESNNQFKTKTFHPTQKPVALLEYLIKTYTDRGGGYRA